MNITKEQNGVEIKASKRQLKRIRRRRAIDCKLMRPSNSNPGYFKYNVTIQEKDGRKHTEPCYGIDMQDAISRLIYKERTIKVEKKLTGNPFLIFLVWCAIMSWPAAFGSTGDTPWYLLYAFGGILAILALGGWWYNYINKQ
jgi:hypothetical protein